MIGYDIMGEAIYNYYFEQDKSPILVHSEDFDTDEMHPEYFFRTFNQMPPLEQFALNESKGRVLDVGACAGCHSVILQERNCDVVSLEQSEKCVAVMKKRGLHNVVQENFFDFQDEKLFDTVLLLMNGTGIAGNLANFKAFLLQIKKLLKPDGKVFIDSSDLIYLYENEDGTVDINLAGNYYGELRYQTEYKGKLSASFSWLYVDYHMMKSYVDSVGLKIESVRWGEHYDFLAVLTHQ